MSVDPTKIKLNLDPRAERMTGRAIHGNTPFSVPYMTEIMPGLWQGGCAPGLLLPPEIKHLVSLYPWEQYTVEHDIETVLSVRMYDSLDQTFDQVGPIAEWAYAAWKKGPTLVHCQAGLNRSSLVVASVLMFDGCPSERAIELIREKRSPACLCNSAFEAWLRGRDS